MEENTVATMLQNHQKTTFDHKTDEEVLSDKVDEIFEEYDLPLRRCQVHTYIATRFKRKLGQACYNKIEPHGDRLPGNHVLRINDDLFGNSKWAQVVRHELAHIAQYEDDGFSDGHGALWKAWAVRLDVPPRARTNAGASDSKYTVECPDCGMSFGRHRKSKKVKRVDRYYCTECETDLFSYETGDRPEKPEPGECYVD